jgi:hypothetical protein
MTRVWEDSAACQDEEAYWRDDRSVKVIISVEPVHAYVLICDMYSRTTTGERMFLQVTIATVMKS